VLIGKIKTIDNHLAAALDALVSELALNPLLDLPEKIVHPEQEDCKFEWQYVQYVNNTN
jgi:hypothetical protein